MATSYVTIGSKFRPFSYDELIRPLMESTAAHQAIENEYAELDTKASVWKNIANEQTDPTAYRMYKNYSDELRKQADLLATDGLTQSSKRNLLKMKGRYSQEITPIEQAYTRRRQLADEQRKALAENPTLMYQRDASTMSLDDFIANPELDYGASYSGALLAKQAGDMASNLAKSMRTDPRQWESILKGQYWQTKEVLGYTPEEIILSAQFDKDAPQELRNIIDYVYGSSGMDKWADKPTRKRAIEYIIGGMYNAIGTTKYDTLQDRGFLTPYERWKMREEEGETPIPQQFIFYDYVGTELNVDDNANFRNLNRQLQKLREYKTYVDRGEKVPETIKVPVYTTTAEYRGGVPITKLTDYKEETNPLATLYKELSAQYGTDDIDVLIKEQELSLKRAVSVNKYAKFKTAQSDLAMRELRAALLSGVEDWSDKKEVRKRIHKLGDSKSAPDEEILSKIFNDSSATIQFNPVTGKSIIEGAYGIYEIDNTAAFHNIGVPTKTGIVPGDEFLRRITNYVNSSKYGDSDALKNIDSGLNLFFGALYNSYNGGAPEAPKTNAKASTFPL